MHSLCSNSYNRSVAKFFRIDVERLTHRRGTCIEPQKRDVGEEGGSSADPLAFGTRGEELMKGVDLHILYT